MTGVNPLYFIAGMALLGGGLLALAALLQRAAQGA